MEINGFEFFEMKALSAEQLQDCFEIIKHNLPFEGIVFHAQDEDIWKNNLLQSLQNKSNTFVIIKKIAKFAVLLVWRVKTSLSQRNSVCAVCERDKTDFVGADVH